MRGLGTPSGLGAAALGRQAFEDAQFHAHTRTKLKILEGVMQQETKYDAYFSAVIILNLIVIGVETDLHNNFLAEEVYGGAESYGTENIYGPSNPFYWIETVFLVIFLVELGLRFQLHWRRTQAEAAEVERQKFLSLPSTPALPMKKDAAA